MTPTTTQPRLTDAQVYAHYKKTALVEDLKFLLRGNLSPELRAMAEAIVKPTKADLVALRQVWREEKRAYEVFSRMPAIGTAAWHGRDGEESPAQFKYKSRAA